ncbi:MAG: hypothetical protein Kow0056_15130 [Coriobacteriia bacterium]
MKRYLLVLLGAAALAACVTQAGAYFTARTSVADNVVTAGTVEVSAEPTSSALSVPLIAPGQTVSKTLTVRNDGNLDSSVVITAAKKAGYTDMYESLALRVVKGSESLYEGGLANLRTAPFVVAAGSATDLEFELSLPASADDSLQGDYVRFTLYVDAEQVHP